MQIPRLEPETNRNLGISTGTETIVLLEKDPAVRHLISELLALAGYEVRETADSAAAVRLIEEGVHLADLLLADARLSSENLTQLLAKRFPNLRILLTSECEDDPTVRNIAESVPVLLKPITPGALMAKVRDVLDRPRAQRAVAG